MAPFNKLSKTALSSTGVFLALAAFVTAPAQAALFKFSFTSEEANGYFIYDTSTPPDPYYLPRKGTDVYPDAAKEYNIDLGDRGVFEGTTGDPIIFLVRPDTGALNIESPEIDRFILEVRSFDRQPPSPYTFLANFVYPKGTFGDSTELPTTVPSTALAEIYANVDFPNTLGEAAFVGNVQTRIERVPEPASVYALLGVGAWLLLHRQLRKVN
jgi:hypothetical protein